MVFFIVTSIFFVITGVIPILLTHLHYVLKNYNVDLKVDNKNKKLYYKGKLYSFDEINVIEMHQSLMKLKKSLQLLPSSDYHYSKLIFNNRDILYITCLLVSDFDLGLIDKKIIKGRIVASILFEKIFTIDID